MTPIETVVRTLPVRPRQRPGESDPGYLLRVSTRNGLPGAARLLSLCGVRAHGRARYCPACMGDTEPTWSSTWTEAGRWWCSEHGIWLVDECSQCGRSLTWRGIGWARCRCGAVLSKAMPLSVSPNVMLFAPTELGRGSLVQWLGALSTFGLEAKAFKRAESRGQSTVRSVVEAGASMRVAWPSSFYGWLQRHRSMPGGLPAVTVNTAWPGLVRQTRRLASNGDRSLVSVALTTFLDSAHRRGTPLLGRNPSVRQSSKSLTATAKAIGVSLKRLQIALPVAMPGEAATYTTAAGRTRGSVHPDFAPLVSDFMRDGISINQAACLLGLSRKRVMSLANAKLLCGWGRYVSKQSCLYLQDRLIGLAHAWLAPADAEPLAEVLRLCVPEPHNVLVFNGLIAQAIPLYRVAVERPVGQTLLRRADVVNFLRARHVANCDAMTVVQAASRLRVKQEVAYHLIRRGLLTSRRGTVGRRPGTVITAEAIAEFERCFVPLAALAAAAGVGGRGSVSWALSQGLTFVSGPVIDGGRQYFVSRPGPEACAQSGASAVGNHPESSDAPEISSADREKE